MIRSLGVLNVTAANLKAVMHTKQNDQIVLVVIQTFD